MLAEEWRPTHHPNYDVSDWGRVRSRARGYLRILKPGIASHGYPTVCLGTGNTNSVHVLVAAAFLGPCPTGQEVRHKDDDKRNPRLTNLEYGTRTQNILDAVSRGRWNHRKKTSVEDCVEILRLKHQGLLHRDIAALFGVSRQLVSRIK